MGRCVCLLHNPPCVKHSVCFSHISSLFLFLFRGPAEFQWSTSVKWNTSSPPRSSSSPQSKLQNLTLVGTPLTSLTLPLLPRFPLFFSPSPLTPRPSLFFSPSRILAGLRPADQWRDVWLRLCGQRHRGRPEHRAISPRQQREKTLWSNI